MQYKDYISVNRVEKSPSGEHKQNRTNSSKEGQEEIKSNMGVGSD